MRGTHLFGRIMQTIGLHASQQVQQPSKIARPSDAASQENSDVETENPSSKRFKRYSEIESFNINQQPVSNPNTNQTFNSAPPILNKTTNKASLRKAAGKTSTRSNNAPKTLSMSLRSTSKKKRKHIPVTRYIEIISSNNKKRKRIDTNANTEFLDADNNPRRIGRKSNEVVAAINGPHKKPVRNPAASNRQEDKAPAPSHKTFKPVLPNTSKLSGPSIGFEIEELPDWPGAGRIVLKRIDHIKYPHDAYDAHIVSTQPGNLYNPKELSLSVDYNRDKEVDGAPRRAGIEFRNNPYYLTQPQNSASPEEMLFMLKHLENWRRNKCSYIVENKIPSDAGKHYFNIMEWVEIYNKLVVEHNKANPFNIKQNIYFIIPEAKKFGNYQWCLELDADDIKINAKTRYSTQINAAIPTKALCSPEMRSLFPRDAQYLIQDMEKERSRFFHTLRPHKPFLDYEARVYKNSIKLADNFFKEHLHNKISKPGAGVNRKLDKVRAFLRTMVYQIAMISTSQEHLNKLFYGNKTVAKSLVKDLFPHGMMKFTLNAFFNELLTENDRHALLPIPRSNIIKLCEDAINLANNGKTTDVSGSFIVPGAQFPVNKFYEYVFEGKSDIRIQTDKDGLRPPDPMAFLIDKILPTSNIGYNKSNTRIKRAGVVEFRAPEGKDRTAKAVEELTNKSIRSYKTFCDLYANSNKRALRSKTT